MIIKDPGFEYRIEKYKKITYHTLIASLIAGVFIGAISSEVRYIIAFGILPLNLLVLRHAKNILEQYRTVERGPYATLFMNEVDKGSQLAVEAYDELIAQGRELSELEARIFIKMKDGAVK